MIAVLEDAINCLRRRTGGQPWRYDHEAAEWMQSDCRDWPFSFLNICEVLEIDARRIRQALQERTRLAARAPSARAAKPEP